MNIRYLTTTGVFLAGLVAFPGARLSASVLFENSVRDFQASGPIALGPGQSANACATNLDNSPVAVLIALLTADTTNLLASKQVTLQPGTGVCVSFANVPSPNQQLAGQTNIVAFMVPNGHLNANGGVAQDRLGPGGGGCIVASLQIQMVTVNNTPGQTILYAQMAEHPDKQ